MKEHELFLKITYRDKYPHLLRNGCILKPTLTPDRLTQSIAINLVLNTKTRIPQILHVERVTPPLLTPLRKKKLRPIRR